MLEEVGYIAKTGGWELDTETGDLYWSEEVYRIYDPSMDEQISKVQAISHYPKEALSCLESHLNRLLGGGEEYRLELPLIDATGTHKWVRTTGKPEFDKHGKVIRAFGAFEYITKERALLLKEVENKNYLRAIRNSLSDAVITINANGQIRHTNTPLTLCLGMQNTNG